jgi:DNA-directed RNA polymerase subunit RPC12/RpoP
MENKTSKPLPPGGVVPVCAACGRQLDGAHMPVCSVADAPPCPECGSRLRVWERRPASWLDNLRYRWRLRRWRRDRKELGGPGPA